ncbi:MAG TPA: hypothetical protein VGE54_07170 [Brevundimonas sp.]
MKPSLAAIALVASTALVACNPRVPAEPKADTAAEQPAEAAEAKPAADSAPATPAAKGAPAYAALYPGAEPTAPATFADGPDGPGGMVTFSTSATPDAVVDFYKQRAQAAGLAPVSAMDQGETRAWSAAKASGANVQVVASPDGAGATSVQLSWSAGR